MFDRRPSTRLMQGRRGWEQVASRNEEREEMGKWEARGGVRVWLAVNAEGVLL